MHAYKNFWKPLRVFVHLGWTGANCDEDIDECLANATICGPSAKCTNTLGIYKCECYPGSEKRGDTCAGKLNFVSQEV